jgi:CRISPR-associated protein Cmr1
MYNAEFEVEALTPIFMHGANKIGAELRAASIKGIMRWWFRALAGNYFGDEIEDVRKAENYVFGSTGGRSRVVVDVCPTKFPLDKRPVPMVWKRGNGRLQLQAIPENTSFWISLQSHDELAIKLACISTWAMIVLGGIGGRHTRGAGSLKIKNDIKIPENFNLDLNFSFNDLPKELPSEIDKAIDKTTTDLLPKLSQKLGLKQGHKNGNACLRYSALTQKCAHVYLWEKDANGIYYKSNNFSSPQSLMDKFENVFKNPENSRLGYEDPVFGLPKGDPQKRRISPMHVGAIKTKEGDTFLKIVVFRTSEFHPEPEIKVNWDVIYTFLEKELRAKKNWKVLK